MNINENLVFLKGEDKTKEIISINTGNRGKEITFTNRKTYTYSYNSIEWFRNPKEIDITGKIVYINNTPLRSVTKVLKFEGYVRLIFTKDYSKVHRWSDIMIVKSTLEDKKAKNTFNYLKELANCIGVRSEKDNETLISKQYDKLDFVNPDSVLAFLLNPSEVKSKDLKSQIIYPFGFNKSQKEGTERALRDKVSIIEGPPGTGKTQTILNIIANIVYNNKTVAVVSNNNSATDNVYEKLEKNDLSFIAGKLGNRDNKARFIEGQSAVYPCFKGWRSTFERKNELKNMLEESMESLEKNLKKKNELAKSRELISSLYIEKEYFDRRFKNNDEDIITLKAFRKLNSKKLLSLATEVNESKGLKSGFLNKLRLFIKYGLYDFEEVSKASDMLIDSLFYRYYEEKISEISSEIEVLEKHLLNYKFDEEMKSYSKKSMELFKDYLTHKYESDNRRVFREDDLWKNFEEVNKEYPLILSTTHSIINSVSKNYMFDYLIIDEASQVDLVTGAIACACCKNIIVVGDLKQLPNVVSSDVKEVSDTIFSKHSLCEAYRYSSNSILSCFGEFGVARTLLKEHYRCHPKIIGYCNKKFYNGELIILTEENQDDEPLKLIVSNKGNHARGNSNQRQIDIIKNEVLNTLSLDDTGIITPYRNQVRSIREDILGIEVDTVHKYQGREMKNIILSTVANDVNDFIDDKNLINVAVSRAIDKFILVTSDFEKDSNITDLIKYIRYNSFEENDESKVSSIFDYLYKAYSDERKEYLKRYKKVSEYESENLMYSLITDVLLEEGFETLKISEHVPLRLLLKNYSLMDDDERRFALNRNTHVDFVIYDSLDKKPILAIEVDGHKYHENNQRQKERDMMKDRIVNNYGIKLERFKTTGSMEKEKLINLLNGIVK